MRKVRLGIVGMGGIGMKHAQYLSNGEVDGVELTAICNRSQERLKAASEKFGNRLHAYDNYQEMFTSGTIDAVLIATSHYSHPAIAISAFQNNLHVLIEKPAGVFTKQVTEMNRIAKASGKVFGIMYNQRTNPLYQKLRELIASGEIGEIRRTNWIATTWYRNQSYFDSSAWRATWAGEGGGVLINQSSHQLDLWQWTMGMMPSRIRAFCQFGKYHNIEVEDNVTAYVEYENGATGVFITTTGETPGTNRYEIVGDRGKVVIEDGKITFHRLRTPETKFSRQNSNVTPECWKVDIPIAGNEAGTRGITQNFVDAILYHKPLLAPGEEGINGLMLANAMYLSTWTDDWVNLPINEELYHEKLEIKIRESIFKGK